MFWGILHRTIFMELVRVFLLALVALTGILLLGGIFAEATQRGLSPAQVLTVIPLLIPNTLPYTLPTTTLFATCVIYGRLAHDNEILAIKAAGVNVLHIVSPAIVLGALASAATFALYMDLIPSTHNILRTQICSDMEELLYMMLKRDGYFRHSKVDYEIYVRRVEGRTLIDAEFRRREPKGDRYDAIMLAREAELHVNANDHLLEVHMHYLVGKNGLDEVNDFGQDGFIWRVELPEMKPTSYRPSQLRWLKLFARETELRSEKEHVQAVFDALQANMGKGDASSPGKAAVAEREALEREKERLQRLHVEIANVVAEYHLRPSLALGCLCFVLVGCPIGIWFSKSDYLSAFITCFMPIVVVYYPLLLCGINMAKSGTVHPATTIWVANILMAVTALFLFRRLVRN